MQIEWYWYICAKQCDDLNCDDKCTEETWDVTFNRR